jgi:hypothetical protein
MGEPGELLFEVGMADEFDLIVLFLMRRPVGRDQRAGR